MSQNNIFQKYITGNQLQSFNIDIDYINRAQTISVTPTPLLHGWQGRGRVGGIGLLKRRLKGRRGVLGMLVRRRVRPGGADDPMR